MVQKKRFNAHNNSFFLINFLGLDYMIKDVITSINLFIQQNSISSSFSLASFSHMFEIFFLLIILHYACEWASFSLCKSFYS